MSDPVLQTTIEVSHKGEKYEFRIPSLVEEIKLGMHERNIRRELDPSSGGAPEGLDVSTTMLVRAAAAFEVLLKTSTAKWPFSEGRDKEPVVDFRKFPPHMVEEVAAIGFEFETKLQRFRAERNPDPNPPGAEAVAGQPAAG
jgi:hypothetical protein